MRWDENMIRIEKVRRNWQRARESTAPHSSPFPTDKDGSSAAAVALLLFSTNICEIGHRASTTTTSRVGDLEDRCGQGGRTNRRADDLQCYSTIVLQISCQLTMHPPTRMRIFKYWSRDSKDTMYSIFLWVVCSRLYSLFTENLDRSKIESFGHGYCHTKKYHLVLGCTVS